MLKEIHILRANRWGESKKVRHCLRVSGGAMPGLDRATAGDDSFCPSHFVQWRRTKQGCRWLRLSMRCKQFYWKRASKWKGRNQIFAIGKILAWQLKPQQQRKELLRQSGEGETYPQRKKGGRRRILEEKPRSEEKEPIKRMGMMNSKATANGVWAYRPHLEPGQEQAMGDEKKEGFLQTEVRLENQSIEWNGDLCRFSPCNLGDPKRLPASKDIIFCPPFSLSLSLLRKRNFADDG